MTNVSDNTSDNSNNSGDSGECALILNRHIFLCTPIQPIAPAFAPFLEWVKKNFCGVVLNDINSFVDYVKINPITPNTSIYFCGDVKTLKEFTDVANNSEKINIIKELSTNCNNSEYKLITMAHVPINMHGVGLFFHNFFDEKMDYFDKLTKEHKFQTLTESNKQSDAFRTGIYLSKVTQSGSGDALNFNLLRCSSNLSGPTDNFRQTDNDIVAQVNEVREQFFADGASFNHVLAQVYNNSVVVSENGKKTEKKAKIKAHSDKTKDMPKNGLIAFCTFYQSANKLEANDHKLFTRLRFRLKDDAGAQAGLTKKFDIVLYPSSLFIIPLSTNRLYTHEIVPSTMSVALLPTRLGYVIRCSKTRAVHENDTTYILEESTNAKVKLSDTNNNVDGIKKLKDLYYKENITSAQINYGNEFTFSLNKGDYSKPIF